MIKKFLFLIICLFMTESVFSQGRNSPTWFEAAITGGFGNSVIYNRNVYFDENIDFDLLSPSRMYGGHLGFSVNMNAGIMVEFTSVSFTQRYGMEAAHKKNQLHYLKTIEGNSYDISILYRYTSLSAVYLETGPKIALLKKLSATNTIDHETTDVIEKINFNDLGTDEYKDPIFSWIFGVGIVPYSSRNDRFRVNTGIRLSYSLSSIVPEANRTPVNDGIYPYDYTYDANTGLFFGMVIAEINYFFGYYGTASCGRSRFGFF